jgi:hypothetical protein
LVCVIGGFQLDYRSELHQNITKKNRKSLQSQSNIILELPLNWTIYIESRTHQSSLVGWLGNVHTLSSWSLNLVVFWLQRSIRKTPL